MSIWPHSREGVGLFFGKAEVLSARRLRGCRFLNCGAGEARARVAVAPPGLGRDAELSPGLRPGLMNVAASRLARANREAPCSGKRCDRFLRRALWIVMQARPN